jgi:RNA polymerase sigma factor (sigma-70 family)
LKKGLRLLKGGKKEDKLKVIENDVEEIKEAVNSDINTTEFSRYMEDVKRFRLLSAEEEKEIGDELNYVRDTMIGSVVIKIESLVKQRLRKKKFNDEFIKNVKMCLKRASNTVEKTRVEYFYKQLCIFFGDTQLRIKFEKLWLGLLSGRRELREVMEPLVMGNLLLVVHISKRFNRRIVELDKSDLIQEGNVGLIRAGMTWDYRESKYCTYAFHWVRQFMTRSIEDKDEQTLRFPVHITSAMNKINLFGMKFEQREGRYPTHEEAAEATGFSENKVKTVRSLIRMKKRPLRMDAPMDGGTEELSTIVADEKAECPYTSSEKSYLKQKTDELLKTLHPREEKVMRLRYGKEMTLLEVGIILGVTRERVRQIEVDALRKLRHHTRSRHLSDFQDNRR